ncbi:MAG: hypothetical protein HXY35_01180 [Chloroflexi bacterium]|nr:hypothetical protein [Chloroflexota bacterium]
MKQDRFLTGILIGIGLLIIVALTMFFVRKEAQTYIAEDTPEGVVHNYVVAVLDRDYEKAYSYLADLEYKPTYEEFRRSFLNGEVNPEGQAVDIGESEMTSDTATVEIALIYRPSDPFSTGYRNVSYATLIKQNGAWKLTLMPQYNLWGYSWYQEVPK